MIDSDRLAPDGTHLDMDQIVLFDEERDDYPAGWAMLTLTLPCRACVTGLLRFAHDNCPDCGAPTPWAGGEQ